MPFNVDDPWTTEDTLRELCQPPCEPMFPADPESHDDDCPARGYAATS